MDGRDFGVIAKIDERVFNFIATINRKNHGTIVKNKK